MQSTPLKIGVRNGWLLALLVLLAGPGARGQIGSVAPAILQSVVLHPCASAGTCRDDPETGVSVLRPDQPSVTPWSGTQSSGSMSGRLAAIRRRWSTLIFSRAR